MIETAGLVEGREDFLGHGARPIIPVAKTHVAAQADQPSAGVTTTCGQLRSQHAAEGPTRQPAVLGQADVQLIEPGAGLLQGRQRFDLHQQVWRAFQQGIAQRLQGGRADSPARQQNQAFTHQRLPP
ncbi:hypothetical protein D3C84_1025580 [compost metagenome]